MLNAKNILKKLGLVAVIAGFAVPVYWQWDRTGPSPSLELATYKVQKGLFKVEILERGTLEAVRNIMISSSISGNRAKILSLAPEGVHVEKGQLLVKFDAAPFLEDIEAFKSELERAKAERIQSEEDLKAEIARIDQNLKKGQDEIILAELALKDLQKGAGPLKIERARFEMEMMKKEHEKLDYDFNEFKELVKEGYVSQVEVDRIAHKRDEVKAKYEFAEAEFKNLLKFGHPAELEKSKAHVRAVKEAFDKLKETAEYTISAKKAAIHRAETNVISAQTKLNIAENQLKHTEIYSPIEGFVIYPKVMFSGSSDKRKVSIGDSTFPNQGFMLIPDTSQMRVETQIREVDVFKVKTGQEANVRVDAYPGLVLKGEVTLVGTLAESKESEAGGGKYFNLQILLKEGDSRLRPGMTARVEIVVDEVRDALLVPVESVFRKDGRTVSYVVKMGKVEEREIVTEKSNADFVVVRAGLSEGEQVMLADPGESTGDIRILPKRDLPREAAPISAAGNPL